MNVKPLNDDQRDALQEITNIAMGQAGSSLALLLDTFVHLSVPRINVVEVGELPDAICGLVGKDMSISAVRQSFQGYLRGEAIVIYGADGCKELADLMGYDDTLDREAEVELLLDVANVLVGACLGGITEQLKVVSQASGSGELSFSAPSLMAEHVAPDTLLSPEKLNWTYALLMEVNFRLDKRDFISHLIMMLPEQAIGKMRGILDEFIASF